MNCTTEYHAQDGESRRPRRLLPRGRPGDAPAILLLHGFPTSSQMFRNLIPALADSYRVVAPDYPGYGHSSMPSRDTFTYTFENLAGVIDGFTEEVGLAKYALYVQDYGAPVGYRLASRHPGRITAIVVQNGNAYDEGLDNKFWEPIKAYWAEPGSRETAGRPPRAAHLRRHSLAVHARRAAHGAGQPRRRGPRPVPARPAGQRRDPARPAPQLRQQPAALSEVAGVLPRTSAAGADRLGQERPDLPGRRRRALQAGPEDLEYHLLDAGHFALETVGDEIAGLMRDFLGKHMSLE